jgi:hypothetical protein
VKIAEIISSFNEGTYYSPPLSTLAPGAKIDPASGSKAIRSHHQMNAKRRARHELMQRMFPSENPDMPRPDPFFLAVRQLN